LAIAKKQNDVFEIDEITDSLKALEDETS